MPARDKILKRLISGEGKKIPLFKVFMPKTVLKPLRKVLFSGYIGEGPKVEEFEQKLIPWFGNKNVLALNNGTSAIQLALRLADVGRADEVISTPMTCSATNEPVLAMGAKIVWADIDPWTGNLDPVDVAKKITRKTKAIICVHWGGHPCNLRKLNSIASSHGIKLIEDACQAFGASYKGRLIGSHSDFSCFSFQAVKEMTTVDGGALTLKSRGDLKRGRLLRWYGIDRKTKHGDLRCEADIVEYGYKFHMNDVTAAIGSEQLKYVAGIIKKHRENAKKYDTAFKSLKTISPLKREKGCQSSFWLYTIRVKDRPRFMRYMNRAGITVSRVHSRNDIHTAFKGFRAFLPGVDEFSAEQVSIPVGWWLTKRDLLRVIAAVSGYDKSVKKSGVKI